MGTDKYDRFLGGSVDCNNLPPHDYVDMLREQVMPVAPNGMTQVHLSDSATSANDTAIGVALHNTLNSTRETSAALLLWA